MEKEEKVVEEITEESKAVEEPKTVEETEEVEKPDYPHPALQKIEDDRFKFLSTYKRQNSLKIFISIIGIALIIVAFIVVPNISQDNKNLSMGLQIGLTIVALGGILLASALLRKSINGKMRVYFESFYKNTALFAFEQEGFAKVEVQSPGKINLDQFNESKLYKDVIETGSRGLTEFEYNSIPMAIVDCAGNIRDQKRMRPVFVGKYLFAASKYLEEEPIIVYLKGNERALPPTNLEGITKVKEEVKYDIYSNNKKWEKTLTSDVMKKITAIKTNANLVDLAISIHSGKIHVLMGYDDPMMVLPLQQKYNSKPYEMFKNDLALVVKVVEALNK